MIKGGNIIGAVSIKDTKKGIKIMARKKDTKKGIKTPTEKEIISLDNSPISPLIQEEKEIIPEKFVNIKPKKVEHTKSINIRNKRVYKDLGNGYGMYSDDGSIFKI